MPACSMLSSVPQIHRLQRHRDLDDARQVRVLEGVHLADALVRHQLEVLAAERVRVAGLEVAERHPERTTDPRVEMVDLAGEAVGRQPLA
jgi:hypothetical protein